MEFQIYFKTTAVFIYVYDSIMITRLNIFIP